MKEPTKKIEPKRKSVIDDRSIPIWLFPTKKFYEKLNRVATETGLSRLDALNRGLDALLRETQKQNSPLNRVVKTGIQEEAFRKTMGQVSRDYWSTLTPEEKRQRAQKSAQARWRKREKSDG
jgi:hypothetical protein